MTETGQSTMTEGAPRRSRKTFGWLLFILVLGAVLVGGFYFCPEILKMRAAVAVDPAQAQRLSAVEQQIQTINNRIDDLGARMNKVAAKPVASDSDEGPSSEELTHVQNDVNKLAASITGLQTEVKQAGVSAQHAAQSSMASAIAFIQLRAQAEAGRGFASELTNLRNVAPDDARFRETLDKLAPYAEKGAPVLGVLRDDFINREASVSVAMDKNAVKTWWQRVLAELKGLISVRPIHGADATDALAVTENALADGKVDAAITAVKTLPADGQEVLKDWLVKLQARAAIDTGLQDLSDRFVALAGSGSNQRNEP